MQSGSNPLGFLARYKQLVDPYQAETPAEAEERAKDATEGNYNTSRNYGSPQLKQEETTQEQKQPSTSQAAAQVMVPAATSGATSAGVTAAFHPATAAATSAATSAGVAPAVPEVVQAGQMGYLGDLGTLGTMGAATGAVGGTVAGNKAARKTGDWGYLGYNALNSMNPINSAYMATKDASNLASGHKISDATAVAAAIPTGGFSLLYNPLVAGGKGEEQRKRDSVRSYLQSPTGDRTDNALLDSNYNIKLADGSYYNLGQERDDAGNNIYETIDPTNVTTSYVTGLANVLAAIETAGDKWAMPQLANMLTNAALSNAGGDYMKARQNIMAFFTQRGITPSQALDAVNQLVANGKLDQETGNALLAAIASMRKGGTPQYVSPSAGKVTPGEKFTPPMNGRVQFNNSPMAKE